MKATRYPGYDVMKNIDGPDWDDVTRKVVLDRLKPQTLRYLTEEQADLIEAIGARLIPQDDRPVKDRIRVAPSLDKKLFEDRRDGFRWETLPPQRDAFEKALKGFEETSSFLFGRAFRQLADEERDQVLRAVESGTPPGDSWSSFSARDFFVHMLLPYLVGAYYEHPTAWSETGYFGPSAIRGHVRTWEGGVDPWETKASR
jgi:hypothetical protein